MANNTVRKWLMHGGVSTGVRIINENEGYWSSSNQKRGILLKLLCMYLNTSNLEDDSAILNYKDILAN